MKIILASRSPRRKELLEQMGLEYEVISSNVDETLEKGLSIVKQSKSLALRKTKAVFDKTTGDRIVIGADTMVEKDGILYEKPKDKADAIRMLKELKNDKHHVITSLCVLAKKDGKTFQYIDYDKVTVYLKDMTIEEIEKWVDEGIALDVAGAYAIQGSFMVFVEKIIGNYNTVVGLPVQKLYDVLKEIEKI